MIAEGYPGKEFLISTDIALLDQEWIVATILGTYWGKFRTRDQILSSLKHSLCFGLYEYEPNTEVRPLKPGMHTVEDMKNIRPVGFARVVTDYATMAYLCDVVVDEAYRGKGFGKFLMAHICKNPAVDQRVCILRTRDQQKFYSLFGFTEDSAMIRRPFGKASP